MDYKQKYEKALERARDLYDNHPYGEPPVWTTCEKIFPELKESEDEKIKREILELVSISGNGNQFEEIKNWLEKQCKKPVSTEETPDYNNDFNEAVSQKIRNMVSKLFSGDDNVTSKAFADHFAWELLQLAKAQVRKEQKSWSEEDERMLGKCIDAASGYYSLEDKQNIKDWLRAIKDRVQPQPKQEWSEEDEEMLNNCIGLMQEIDCTQEEQNWLKSLKPHWKPTEEQISELGKAAILQNVRFNKSILESLYNDLKLL